MINLIQKHRFVAILRNIELSFTENVAKSLYNGGVRVFEVTFDPSDNETIKNTKAKIETIKSMYGSEVSVGAGTVLTPDFASAAYEAGAEFLVSPSTDKRVIDYAKSHSILAIPGAYTPTEIMNAYNMGADIVKIFPVAADETAYLKNILSPISHIPFMVTGGVNLDSIEDFMKFNPVALGAGASIVTNDSAKAGMWEQIENNARQHVEKIQEFLSI